MLKLDFINVGYGDAILIRDTEDSFSMLVDCGDMQTGAGGENSRRISAAEFLKEEKVTHLDVLLLTHLHRDHSGGLLELLKTVSVSDFWVNYLPESNYWGCSVSKDVRFTEGGVCLLESLNIFLHALGQLKNAGTKIKLIDEQHSEVQLTRKLNAELYLEDETLFRRQDQIWRSVLNNTATSAEMEELDHFINNTSIRMRLTYQDNYIELPGDVYASCWEKHQLRSCNIVKLPHHGHKDSLTLRILEMLNPQDVVISVSNTRRDDCPAEGVLSLLREKNCKVHITDAVNKSGIVSPIRETIHFEL